MARNGANDPLVMPFLAPGKGWQDLAVVRVWELVAMTPRRSAFTPMEGMAGSHKWSEHRLCSVTLGKLLNLSVPRFSDL